MSKNTTAVKSDTDLGAILGFLSLRIWLALRAIVTGLEKFSGTRSSDVAVTIDGAVNEYGLTESASQKVYGMDVYAGVPKALYSKLDAEPLISSGMLRFFDVILGPMLIIFGVTLLLGFATRISLFALGLIFTSLTMGLILLKQDAGIAWLGMHVLLVAVALFTARHNRLAILKKF